MECIKYIMFAFNVIFWMIGGAMLGLGIWMAVDPAALDSLGAASGMDNEMWAIAVYTFIGIGALVFLLGFLGCWGACVSSSVPLWIYSILVGLILLAEIAVVVLVVVYWYSADDAVAQAMYKDLRTLYTSDPNDALTASWDTMQNEWECCGSYNYTDYKDSKYDNTSQPPEILIPASCCKNDVDVTECQKITDPNYIYNQGCYYALKDFLDANAPIIIGVTCGFAGLQIIGLIFACCLIHDKHDSDKYL